MHDSHRRSAHRTGFRPGPLLSPLSIFVTLNALSCTPGVTDTAADSPHAPLLPDGGCTVDDTSFTGVSWEETTIRTVLRVTWETGQGSDVQVLFSAEDAQVEQTTAPELEGSPGEVLLVGLPQQVDISFRLVADQDGDAVCSDLYQATTGPLPSGLPALDVQIADGTETSPGFVVVPINDDQATWQAIIDRFGRYVWASNQVSRDSRVRLSLDHESVLYLVPGKTDGSVAPGIGRMDMDGTISNFYSFDDVWVDFVELPDGTLLVLQEDIRSMDDQGVERLFRGDALVELPPDGAATTLWSSFDAYTPDLSTEYMITLASDGREVEDWSHCNGLAYSQDDDRIFITSSQFQAVFAVDHATGDTLWALSQDSDDWNTDHSVPLFSAPHSVQPLENGGMLVFNRFLDFQNCSNATEIQLNEETRVATVTRIMESEDCIHVSYLGSAERLPDDNTIISWSSAGQIDEFQPDDTVSLRINLPLGGQFGFATWVDSLY